MAMGTKSTAIGSSRDAVKKAKKNTTPHDPDAPMIGEWDRTKFLEKDLHKAAKDGFQKEEPKEVQVPGPETTPTPPVVS
jgi:hypothetical protein